jgi:transposase-like protein
VIEPETLRRLVAEHCSEQEREAAELVFEQNISIRRAAGRVGVTPGELRGRLDRIRVHAVKQGLEP